MFRSSSVLGVALAALGAVLGAQQVTAQTVACNGTESGGTGPTR